MRTKIIIKTTGIAAVLILVAILDGTAQTTTRSPTKPDEIETLSQAWMQAAMDHDLKTLERLMANDFTLVHPSQEKTTSREQWLQALERLKTNSFHYEQLRVTHYGKSVAVASAVFVVDAAIDGRPFAPVTSVTDVWEKRHGQWQIVTRYATRPEELKKRSAQTEGGWKKIENRYFTFSVPEAFVKTDASSKDSFAQGYVGENIGLGFDYGRFSSDFTSWPKDTKFENVTIDGKAARVGTASVSHREGFPYTTMVRFQLEGSTVLVMSAFCKSEKEVALARKVFESITFKPQKPSD